MTTELRPAHQTAPADRSNPIRMKDHGPRSWCVRWSIEDVFSQAEQDEVELTEAQAREVLDYFSNHYDYVWEVSWELMSQSILECQRDWEKEAQVPTTQVEKINKEEGDNLFTVSQAISRTAHKVEGESAYDLQRLSVKALTMGVN